MDDRLYGIADAFRLNAGSLQRFTEDLQESDWSFAGTNANSIAWIVGHMALYRKMIVKTLGGEVSERPWEELVKRGAAKGGDLASFHNEMVTEFFEYAQRGSELAAHATPEQLDQSIGKKMPNGSETVLGLLSFLSFHETYHLGQLGLLRVELGKKTIG